MPRGRNAAIAMQWLTLPTVVPRSALGVVSVSSASVTVSWPQRQVKDPNNRTMVCIVTVFAVSFYPSGI